jgi:hypothetical protein
VEELGCPGLHPRPEARRQHDGDDDARIAAGTWGRHDGVIAEGFGCIFRRRMLWADHDDVKPIGCRSQRS